MTTKPDHPAQSISVIGFDSAWTDNPKAPGAVCSIRIDRGAATFKEPSLASFSEALAFIRDEQSNVDLCLVALDQPTIVPNMTSMRPVDRVAASVISWLGGGVQPANRSKVGMFDDDAPIWSFKTKLEATEDPELARAATHGLFLIEVFPALAIISLELAFFGRLKAPRYNPQRRKTFKLLDWHAVVEAVRIYGRRSNIVGLAKWLDDTEERERPTKSDQDKLDSAICAVVGYHWLLADRRASLMIGDLNAGYMITPVAPETLARLNSAAHARNVSCA